MIVFANNGNQPDWIGSVVDDIDEDTANGITQVVREGFQVIVVDSEDDFAQLMPNEDYEVVT